MGSKQQPSEPMARASPPHQRPSHNTSRTARKRRILRRCARPYPRPFLSKPASHYLPLCATPASPRTGAQTDGSGWPAPGVWVRAGLFGCARVCVRASVSARGSRMLRARGLDWGCLRAGTACNRNTADLTNLAETEMQSLEFARHARLGLRPLATPITCSSHRGAVSAPAYSGCRLSASYPSPQRPAAKARYGGQAAGGPGAFLSCRVGGRRCSPAAGSRARCPGDCRRAQDCGLPDLASACCSWSAES